VVEVTTSTEVNKISHLFPAWYLTFH